MTTTKEVTVWCDYTDDAGAQCGRWTYGSGQPQRTIAEARQGARPEGWRYRKGRDLCPCHAGTCRSSMCEAGGEHAPDVAKVGV